MLILASLWVISGSFKKDKDTYKSTISSLHQPIERERLNLQRFFPDTTIPMNQLESPFFWNF